MKLIWRISLITFLAIFLTISLYGQYVSAQGEVNKSLILNELQAIAWGSPAQDSAVNQIMLSLRQDSKSHLVLLTDEAKKGKVILTILHLSMRVGDFYFLNPDSKKPRKKEYDINTDTISQEVRDLEAEWRLMLDKLDTLVAKLKVITKDEGQTDNSRKWSMMILEEMARTDTSLVRYFFEDISTIRLASDIDVDYGGGSNVPGLNRTAMSIYYLPYIDVEELKLNVPQLSYIIQYWGDEQWVKRNIDEEYGEEFLELLHFSNLARLTHKPWILFDWILANAKDPDTVILKAIAEEIEKEKSRYYSNPENKGK